MWLDKTITDGIFVLPDLIIKSLHLTGNRWFLADGPVYTANCFGKPSSDLTLTPGTGAPASGQPVHFSGKMNAGDPGTLNQPHNDLKSSSKTILLPS